MEMIRISEEEYTAIKAAAKANKNKRVAKRLEVLELRYEGKSNAEITVRTGFNTRYVTTLMGVFRKQGLAEYIRIKQTSHRRNLSEAEETTIMGTDETFLISLHQWYPLMNGRERSIRTRLG